MLAIAATVGGVRALLTEPANEAGPGPLGMVASVRPAAGDSSGGPVVLRVVAPSYAGAELAVCKIDAGGPEPGTYRLDRLVTESDYDAVLASGPAGGWVVTTGRTGDGRPAVTAYTPAQRVDCTVAAGIDRLLPDRTDTWALTIGDTGKATP
ncbi:hypothetical protein SAMN05443668_13623 [Cryptosporangium aurantiacum]|uniref:Uncharacterized protein n=1 Tax=Cryptosporangium aurantiacum TaxID=134849 RepID=A0A1M7RPJ1_9ACTN|nr:hypothetical protein SAMN05443668_13623 [Cryptosporangium aurantiacum]